MADLTPCDEHTRRVLATSLCSTNKGILDRSLAEFVAKTFPDLLLDVARLLTEQATQKARDKTNSPEQVIESQLKPFFMFEILLGKCPQVISLMYSYFENSSFQPLPEKMFTIKRENDENVCVYTHQGIDDEVVKAIITSYSKYLTYNLKWFSSVWNWGELGRLITIHTSEDIRYLAGCCLSLITKPTRLQHQFFVHSIVGSHQSMIDHQIKHRHLFENTFKPILQTNKQQAKEFIDFHNKAPPNYLFNSEFFTKLGNVLLLKRDLSLESKETKNLYAKEIDRYVPVKTVSGAVSSIAYAVSINKPCLVKGTYGSGKTSILNYIAALTNRLNTPEYIKIQIGDQIDSKLLIGSYVCTEIPGQFEWQPGPITKAMIHGSWIVFEEINSASADILQVIHSIMENGNLTCVSCCPLKLDSPHPDFRIFFTQQVRDKHDITAAELRYVEELCDVVELPELSDSDLIEILESKYKFEKLSPIIVKLFRQAQQSMQISSEQKPSRLLTLRDLFKLCDRVSTHNLIVTADEFSTSDLENMFLDAIHCFLSFLPSNNLFKQASENLGTILNISPNEVERIVFLRKPELRIESDAYTIGRAELPTKIEDDSCLNLRCQLAYTKQSLRLMENISLSIKHKEPVLLVGETGVGKTSIVQHIADLMSTELVVINMSQQSDSSDLLGAFKPVDLHEITRPLHDQFEKLFSQTFDINSNKKFLDHVNTCYMNKRPHQWRIYIKLLLTMCDRALNLKTALSQENQNSWRAIQNKARSFMSKIVQDKNQSSMALAFSEGPLLKAIKTGQWVLLDEINLAEPDVLQCLVLVLDSISKSKIFMNLPNDNDEAVAIHSNFRIFACMNPSTDIGKRDLAATIRGRFTEFYADDILETNDLRLIVQSYAKTCLNPVQIENIVNFYRQVRESPTMFTDISGNTPVYSLRSLCRALIICSNNVCHNTEKSLFESLKITFLQQLDNASTIKMEKWIEEMVFKKSIARLDNLLPPQPKDGSQYVQVGGFWVQQSMSETLEIENYVVTSTVDRNLRSLSRIISLAQRRLPILIQGDTSVGKTSLIMYLAGLTGNKCYRINNHEHTDLQDYVGRYVIREDGEFEFQNGLLVDAMKNGHWIILDELNLAPSDLLEALNRVLDDNRELFIPETRETIKAHSKFMLFATQNPPEKYQGRKFLSRAFRNRFIELHFDEIPGDELEFILHKKCEMPPKYAQKIVTVMKELQQNRRESECFNGKGGFMTLRDLFRWGERYAVFKKEINQSIDWEKRIAEEGLILLEARARTQNEAATVKSIIEKVFGSKQRPLKLDCDMIYSSEVNLKTSDIPEEFKHICFTKEFQKLFVQLTHALKYKEPVLLCGQTGCGKTTACQLYAAVQNLSLLTYNCHLNTESSDFVGEVRPSRKQVDSGESQKQTFPWTDGPLVEAMKSGAIFLMDEISLADDAVLERINSVLEPSRSITLIEKSGEEIHADDSFRLVATMNPGGDYGKKELSPALRNRFTEIYCHNTTDLSQISQIICACLSRPLLIPRIKSPLQDVMLDFLQDYYFKVKDVISLRDISSWCQFLNKTTSPSSSTEPLSLQDALINGASLVYFDQFGTCGHKSLDISSDKEFKSLLKSKLSKIIETKFGDVPVKPLITLNDSLKEDKLVKFKNFFVTRGNEREDDALNFVTNTPTVAKNIKKIVRAMQLDRPILLEGSPGAGKTSVVAALAKLTGNKLIRINLSEQTDLSDLFGCDLPSTETTGDGSPRFCWHDGPMISAIRQNHWILLDEMNLASQSVLEGLNACLDHRGEIYVPELNKTLVVDRSQSRIFACQNPYNQGAARKGLPQSFLNRFTSIYIEEYSEKDMNIIIQNLYPNIPREMVAKMVKFNNQIVLLPMIYNYSDYEFNLRDIIYWCDLMTKYVKGEKFTEHNLYRPDRFVHFVYLDRLRNPNQQKKEVSELFISIFEYPIYEPPYREIKLGEYSCIIARAILSRKCRLSPQLPEYCILKYQLPYLESIAKAIEHNKMPIIVGESGVGKRSMVKILAGLTGNELHIMCANRDMDTLELLGSFEQKSFQREVVDLIEEAKECILLIMNSITKKEFASTWTKVFAKVWAILYSTSIKGLENVSRNEIMTAYLFQLNQMEELIEKVQPLSDSNTEKSCLLLLGKIRRLIKLISSNEDLIQSSGNFGWIDSILIKAIREGKWLLIEDANLMNPATLDRLNSLVEPNGTLSLNEKGSGLHGVEILRPHDNFRLILTMNPEHGELSRAMRNRGVEIYIQTDFYFEDFLMLLNQNGFKQEQDKSCMAYCIMQTSFDTHKKIVGDDEDSEEALALLAYFGLNYITTLTHQVRRLVEIDDLLADLLISFYTRKGFAIQCAEETLRPFILDKMKTYIKTYAVNLQDDRYKWMDLIHDLPKLTGGDSMVANIDRDSKIFLEQLPFELLSEETIENVDVVNTCTALKIFLDVSTYGDFDYRKGFLNEIFASIPKLLNKINVSVKFLSDQLQIILRLLPLPELVPVDEILVDTRDAPDFHYYLQVQDFDSAKMREQDQNKWILTLHGMMLKMIVDISEERSLEIENHTSLFIQSERLGAKEILKEDLVRPVAEITSDMCELFDGLLKILGLRGFDNETLAKIMPKFFWIFHFNLKLKKAHSKEELVAICSQIPMLWALTHQKVIVPLSEICKMADVVYKNKKLSARVKHICDFLDSNLTKPGHIEKEYYKKILNKFAATSKQCEIVQREVDKFFATIVGKYNSRTTALSSTSTFDQIIDTIATSGIIWSNNIPYMQTLYDTITKLVEKFSFRNLNQLSPYEKNCYDEMRILLRAKKIEYDTHEESFKDERNRTKYLNANRQMTAMDQFAPVWQLNFIHIGLAKLTPSIADPAQFYLQMKQILFSINGIIFSPKYYATIVRYLLRLQKRNEIDGGGDKASHKEENINLYTTQLVDHLIENQVFDNHIVGWTKLRVTTSDLPSQAPLLPEYSPILSLVGSFCLDISHLNLNSYLSSSPQLDAMLMFLCRHYVPIKLEQNKNIHDINLAQNLIHLRCKIPNKRSELVGDHLCKETDLSKCKCIEIYIQKRCKEYNQHVRTIKSFFDKCDQPALLKGIKLVYFGYLNYLEYAPVFSLDPSLRAREKLEIYKAELAHIKLELNFRNTLFYWKTGENLQLNEIDSSDAASLPFSIRLLVDRRNCLEKSIKKLSQEHTNRPKSDDGSLYYELRREVETNIQRYSNGINALFVDLAAYATCKEPVIKQAKFQNLISKCRLLIKNLERTISKFRSQYELYSDLITNFQVGMCFVKQGLRCLYYNLEQKMQVQKLGYVGSIQDYINDLQRVSSFHDFSKGTLESIAGKLQFYPRIEKVCPMEKVNEVQSIFLKTILLELNHHISISPSDIKSCIPTVRRIADKFHSSWLVRKTRLEEQRRKQEELYQYKTQRTALGTEISYERQEFIDICSKFPTYDHIYESHFSMPPTSADKENLITEGKVSNLERTVDFSMCIDICKAHYKFFMEASQNLLESGKRKALPTIDLEPVIKLEAETLYCITRHCILTLDQSFDAFTLETNLLQANHLIKTLRHVEPHKPELGSLKSSIETLDEKVFDIYYDPCAHEALRFHEYLHKVDNRIRYLRGIEGRDYDSHPTLLEILKLIKRICSFLITDPLMKFITGSHTLLEKLAEWNSMPIPRDEKMTREVDELEDLIKSWRVLEVESWRNSLHKVKRKYIDSTLCDLWFKLYDAFIDPVNFIQNYVRSIASEQGDFVLDDENVELLYQFFIHYVKDFIEESTLGDYQIRLDLVFSFAIQTRFASLYEQEQQTKAKKADSVIGEEKGKVLKVDYEKLFTYVYNFYIQYQGMLEPVKKIIEADEKRLSKELNTEIRIVAWQGRNLWELKNNFRISHKKLNKVMNRYLEVLRQPLPPLNPVANHEVSELHDEHAESTKISTILGLVRTIVEDTQTPPSSSESGLKSLRQSSKVVGTMKNLYLKTFEPMSQRFVNNLTILEDAINDNYEAIHNFNSQRVQEIVIDTKKDSKEDIAAKHKLCRQMYNSKKFSMQSVFKTLQNLGVSYRRGLSRSEHLDLEVLSSEPLRGMIQNQSQAVLEGSKELVDDGLIVSCNQMYRKLIAKSMTLLGIQVAADDLDEEQLVRITGFSLDMTYDVIRLNRSAAILYRHLMQIQAATTKLKHLQAKKSKDNVEANSVAVYSFKRVHRAVEQFNHLVVRAYMALAKLEKLADCYLTSLQLEDQKDEQIATPAAQEHFRTESSMLRELVCQIDEKQAIFTRQQYQHIQANLHEVRASIAHINSQLRDKLHQTSSNYLYSQDDIDQLRELYQQFVLSINQLLEDTEDNLEKSPNKMPGTALGTLLLLLDEATTKLQPKLDDSYLSGQQSEVVELGQHPNLERLNIRLYKLVKYTKLASQRVYKQEELWTREESVLEQLTVAARHKLRPFNYIDGGLIMNNLNIEQVAKYTGDFIKTINRADFTTNIHIIVTNLTPILHIYTREVSSYLNIILTSLHLKLIAADQLTTFFTDLKLNGFGLPFKPIEESGEEKGTGKITEDNTGFGEGVGSEDVSKKLEFESQLDDLNKNEENQENKEGDEKVEAHDDGIEMSDNIDATAQGPEDKESEDKDREKEVDDEEDQEGLDELDKEMDRVDQDENKLDSNLWGDDEEKANDDAEDDEQDLRETDVDQNMEPENETTQLEAKDDGLTKSNDNNKELTNDDYDLEEQNDDNDDFEEQNDGNDDLEQSENHEISVPPSMEDEDHDESNMNQEEELDLDQEAKEALQDTLEQPTADGESEDTQIEMSISDENMDAIDDTEEAKEEDGEPEETDKIEPTGLEDKEHKRDDGDDQVEDQAEVVGGLSAEQEIGGDDQERSKAQDKTGGTGEGEPVDDSSKQDQESAEELVQGLESTLDKNSTQNNESNNKPIKRTFAQLSELNECQLKRQKVLEGVENAEEEPTPGDLNDNLKSLNKVRHVDEDKAGTINVIDLVSSDEEDEHILKQTIEQSQEQPSVEDQDKSRDRETEKIIKDIDEQLSKKAADEQDSVDADKLINLWLECTKSTNHLVPELCQQLQIVLQPTKMSKYKGDYKSGKRLNMRKIISYIASNYRKDKIWLRRTKPSKRTYNITIAVDNSSSMSENNCRQMTYQSLSLLAKSLSIIEAGRMSVVSFGQQVRCIHDFDQPYMDAIGAQWLRELRFNESRTSYSDLLGYSEQLFAKQIQLDQSCGGNLATSQLLVILSDGRNVTSEEEEVKSHLRQLKAIGVLTLFIIIDDLKMNGNNSIVNTKRCIGTSGNQQLVGYMELFPFPFYVILRQLETMPSIVGNSLRQWFELVSG